MLIVEREQKDAAEPLHRQPVDLIKNTQLALLLFLEKTIFSGSIAVLGKKAGAWAAGIFGNSLEHRTGEVHLLPSDGPKEDVIVVVSVWDADYDAEHRVDSRVGHDPALWC